LTRVDFQHLIKCKEYPPQNSEERRYFPASRVHQKETTMMLASAAMLTTMVASPTNSKDESPSRVKWHAPFEGAGRADGLLSQHPAERRMAPVLHLDPVRRPAGTIRPIFQLRHQILQAE
jgi:hypothetical protein